MHRQSGRWPRRQRKTELPLPAGRQYYAVIDVEAIVLTHVVNVVEQLAFVLYSEEGAEVWAEKHMIYQPYDERSLSEMYDVDIQTVKKSADAYRRITGDNPIHPNPIVHERWTDVRKHVQRACRDHAATVYAKGISLESSVFYGALDFQDLAWWGCPKYPLPIHDPLNECRFFAQWIPEIRTRQYNEEYYSFWT